MNQSIYFSMKSKQKICQAAWNCKVCQKTKMAKTFKVLLDKVLQNLNYKTTSIILRFKKINNITIANEGKKKSTLPSSRQSVGCFQQMAFPGWSFKWITSFGQGEHLSCDAMVHRTHRQCNLCLQMKHAWGEKLREILINVYQQ